MAALLQAFEIRLSNRRVNSITRRQIVRCQSPKAGSMMVAVLPASRASYFWIMIYNGLSRENPIIAGCRENIQAWKLLL